MATRTRIGYCLYCGNSRMVELPEDSEVEPDQNQIDGEATWNCQCPEARKVRAAKEQRQLCLENIKDMVYEEYPDIAEILTECIHLVQSGDITKIVINTGDGRKITMKNSKDGLLVRKEWSTAFEVTA